MSERELAQRLARELYEHRHDPEEWADEAEEIQVRPSQTTVVSCRLPKEEFLALEESARAAGETVSEYVRKAIALRRAGPVEGQPKAPGGRKAIIRVSAAVFDVHAFDAQLVNALRPWKVAS